MGSSLSLLRKATFVYLRVAALHSLVKLCYLLYKRKRSNQQLEKGGFPCVDIGVLDEGRIPHIHRLHEWRRESLEEHNDAPIVWYKGASNEIVARSGEFVKHFLKDDFNNFTKPSGVQDYGFHMLGEWLGKDGIFVLRHGKQKWNENDDAAWYIQRKIAAGIFTRGNFNNFMQDCFVEKGHIFVKHLESSATEGQHVDMQKLFFSYTMDSIMKIFFGRETNTLGGDFDAYSHAYDEAHRSLLLFLYKNVPWLIISSVLPYPFGGLLVGDPESGLIRFLRSYNKDGIKFQECVNTLTDESHKIIKERRKDPDLKNKRDLLALFLNTDAEAVEGLKLDPTKVKLHGGQAVGGSDFFAEKYLRDVVLSFIIAGRDTTACTLTWAFYQLTQNPEVQKKLQKEIDEKLKGEDPTAKTVDTSNMPYLNGVIYEALRLHPPVPEDAKISQNDTVLDDGTFIPASTRVIYSPYAMGRDPKRYPNPLEFKPERWIPFKQPSLFEFPVFQAGPRTCLGMNMALIEAKIITAMLLKKYTFSLKEGEADNITYSLMITMSLCNSKMQDSHNLWIQPHLRTAS